MSGESENKEAERIVRFRKKGNAIFQPSELGFACPICGACDHPAIRWSEYNHFIWCGNCNLDIPSCLSVKYPELNITDEPLTDRQRVERATSIFLTILEEMNGAN